MKILAFGDMKSGCYWVRVKRPIEQLGKLGHEVFLANPNQAVMTEGWDIVVFNNLMGSPVEGKEDERNASLKQLIDDFKAEGAKIVYDCDDAQELHPEFFKNETKIKMCIGSYYLFLKEADLITTTTPELAEHLRKYTDKPIEVLPNCINPEEFPEKKQEKKTKIGFAGSPSHIYDLDIVFPAIAELKLEHDIFFEIFGLRLQGWKCVDPVRMWDFPTRLAEMGMDIGICPLKNNEFNINKSPIKFLEYVSVGTMALASNILPYSREMKPEWLVDDDKWHETLEKFILDKDLREKTLKDQQAWVLENRDIRKQVKLWESAYQTLITK